ncbi:smad nuclear-interacting protein 1-like [Gigantopelta aegis]|uniref:smad nuclear-interacting protein 1-like n=1 Tax=Gigantopelta aegis TaxID=1735272 RepID=UPI001B889337|nr:smad nuclear-interacting protein 1-like [Gigantopelta aegis]
MPRSRSPFYERKQRYQHRHSRSNSPEEYVERKHTHTKKKKHEHRSPVSMGHSRDHQHSKRRRSSSSERGAKRSHHDRRTDTQRLDPYRRIKQEPVDNYTSQQQERERNNRKRAQNRKHRDRENEADGKHTWGRPDQSTSSQPGQPVDKEKPDFEVSGKLTEDTNTYKGVVIKYNEPPEARKPKKRWRLYGFKDDEALPVIQIHRQSAYLLGRDRRVADIPIDHPSCSKQQAALQFRLVEFKRADGTAGRRVRPYVIDLNSANGTFVNNKKIDPQRYVELLEKDVLKFGFSTREYVILHEDIDTSEVQRDEDDDDGDDENRT